VSDSTASAAPQASGPAYSGDIEQALGLLRALYGDEYTFGYDPDGGLFWVIKYGVIGSLLTAPTPEGLGRRIDGEPGAGQAGASP